MRTEHRWRWRLRNTLGRWTTTRHHLTETSARRIDPAAERVPGSLWTVEIAETPQEIAARDGRIGGGWGGVLPMQAVPLPEFGSMRPKPAPEPPAEPPRQALDWLFGPGLLMREPPGHEDA